MLKLKLIFFLITITKRVMLLDIQSRVQGVGGGGGGGHKQVICFKLCFFGGEESHYNFFDIEYLLVGPFKKYNYRTKPNYLINYLP